MEQSNQSQNYLNLFVELLALVFLGLVLTLIYNDTIILDELEHLRASYFVSLGEMPYRDFFEHHHPMIWFMFAPIISVLPHLNLVVLYVAKTLAFIFSVGSSIVIYLIAKRFMGGVFSAVATLVFFFVYFATWYSFSIFKPDTFMRFFYLCGLYNFLLYYERQTLKNLILSGILFTIAFLFLQTITFSILPLIFPVCYILYKNTSLWKDFAVSAIAPTAVLVAFYTFLYATGTLENYLQLNLTYNANLFTIIHSHTPLVIPIFLIEILLAYAALVYVYCKHYQTAYFNIFAILFVCESINHLYFPAVYPHYLILLFLFSGFILAFALNKMQKKWIFRTLLSILILNLVLNYFVIAITYHKLSHAYLREYDKHPEASMVNFDVTFFSVFSPKFSYYWFYPNFEFVDNALFHRLPDYDINKIIDENKVEYIFYDASIKQKFNFEEAAKKFEIEDCYARHSLDVNILKDYQKVLPGLYKRKN